MSEQPNYFRVYVKNLLRQHEDEFSLLCFEAGAAGVEERLKYEQPDVVYDPTIVNTPILDLNVYFTEPPSPEFLPNLTKRFREIEASLTAETAQDWMSEWKKNFKAFQFAGPFWIVPSWLETPVSAQHTLWIDPGMAFGTGTHETTRLAGELLLETLSSGQASDVLDVGTGTGVLALLAERTALAQNIIAIDIDPEARRVARENLALNHSQRVQVPELNLPEVTGAFDVVIANIIDGVLIQLKPDLLARAKASSELILSGILREREQVFVDGFLRGLKVLSRRELGEWVAYRVKV